MTRSSPCLSDADVVLSAYNLVSEGSPQFVTSPTVSYRPSRGSHF